MLQLLLWIVVIFLLFVLLVRFLCPYGYNPFGSRVIEKIPGAESYPVIGNLLNFNIAKADYISVLTNMRKKYGKVFQVHGLGRTDVIVSDVGCIEKLLSSTKYIKKGTDYLLLRPWLQEGLLTSTGSKWHTRRKILTPTFHFKILEDYVPVFSKNSDILVEKLREHADKPFVEINNFIKLCTLDIIAETAMGTTINAQCSGEVEYVKAVQRISEIVLLRELTILLHRDFVFMLTPMGREQEKVLKILQNFTRKIIKERRAEYEARKAGVSHSEEHVPKRRLLAFLDQLIELSDKGEKLSDVDIQEEVDTFMFEGHDTTTSAISWAIFLLGLHPDVQGKAVKELEEIFGDSDRPPTYEDLAKMKYLEQVIKETLRLYPSVPAYMRMLETDVELMGYHIPAGVNISILPIVIHRDPELYPDPDKFDPDRFSLDACQNRHPYAYLPFSAGPRSCIGQRFAMMEEKVILSTVLRNFQLRSLDKTENLTLLMELILRPQEPLRIHLIPRKKAIDSEVTT